jgi:hypothetical protein
MVCAAIYLIIVLRFNKSFISRPACAATPAPSNRHCRAHGLSRRSMLGLTDFRGFCGGRGRENVVIAASAGLLSISVYWTNPRSGSRVSRRRRAHDNKCAGFHRVALDDPPIASYNAKVCAKKLLGASAKRKVPDTAAPTYSTASRGPFAALGEFSRYFNHPKTYKTHKLKIRATLAPVVLVSPHIAPPLEPCHGWVRAG